MYKIKIPAKIGNKKIFIISDVVETSIPLLLKESMKKADTKINFTDKVRMFEQNQIVKITSSGHFAIMLNSNYNILL